MEAAVPIIIIGVWSMRLHYMAFQCYIISLSYNNYEFLYIVIIYKLIGITKIYARGKLILIITQSIWHYGK